jgi:hypothetical protein
MITVEPNQVFFHAIGAYANARTSLVKRMYYKQLQPPRPKKIGIIVRQQNYFSNGVGQNCIFMMQSFEALGYDVDLLVNWKQGGPQEVSPSYPIRYKNIANAKFNEYGAIVFGAQTPITSDIERMKAAGVRRIMFSPCNVIDAFHNDHFLYKCRETSLPLFESQFSTIADEIWVTENHRESSLTYLEVINKHKTPVYSVPLVWSPLFLRDKAGTIPMNRPHTGSQLDIIIMEPNISYCKSGWLPLVACEKLFLDYPDTIHNVYFFNTPERDTAFGMLHSLDLWTSKKLRTMARLPITDILSFFSDPAKHGNHQVVFVSHSINVPLNYAYFDALYSGFPLVHNSPALKAQGLGYYYETIEQAATAVRTAPHIFDMKESLKRAHAMLAKQDPYSKECTDIFQDRLKSAHTKSASI